MPNPRHSELNSMLISCFLQVYLPVASPGAELKPIHERDYPDAQADPPSATQAMLKIMKKLDALDAARDLTAREFISLSALASVLLSPLDADIREEITDGIPRHKQTVALLLHLSALRHCSLEHRSFAKEGQVGAMDTGSRFLTNFFDAAQAGLAYWFSADFADRRWDAFDLFDGRLFINISAWLESDATIPCRLSLRTMQMAKLVDELGNANTVDALSSIPLQTDGAAGIANPIGPHIGNQPPEIAPSVLPFNHPIMDQFLEDVWLRLNKNITTSPVLGKIFQELQHWHNAHKPLDPKHVAKPLDFRAARRYQRLMAGTLEYAASLTGTSGKVLEPEVIITLQQMGNGKKKSLPKHAASTPKRKGARTDESAQKSNKQKALEEGDARKQEKLAVLCRSAAAVWRERCVEFENQPSLVKRFLQVETYLASLPPAHEQIIGSEVLVYLVNVLLQLRRSPKTPKSAG